MLIMFIVSSLTYCNNVIINMLLYERFVVSLTNNSPNFLNLWKKAWGGRVDLRKRALSHPIKYKKQSCVNYKKAIVKFSASRTLQLVYCWWF